MNVCDKADDDDDVLMSGNDLTQLSQVLCSSGEVGQFRASYSIRHQNALRMEVSILETVLRRNSQAHAKTKYFRHSSCTFKRFLHYSLPNLYMEFCRVSGMSPLDSNIQRTRRKSKNFKYSILETDAELLMDIEKWLDGAKENDSSSMYNRATGGITECRQRIEATYRYCRQEIQRGFFLPLLTVISASWARIYTLMVRLQSFILRYYVHQCCKMSKVLQSVNAATAESTDWKRRLSSRIDLLREKCLEMLRSLPKDSPFQTSTKDNSHHPQPTVIQNRMQRTEHTLNHLGLRFLKPKLSSTKNLLASCSDIADTIKHQIDDTNESPPQTNNSSNLDQPSIALVDDDMGERFLNHLAPCGNPEFSAPSMLGTHAKQEDLSKELIDQNETMVQQYQSKIKKRISQTTKRTKAKRKKKDPDFFDQLFK